MKITLEEMREAVYSLMNTKDRMHHELHNLDVKMNAFRDMASKRLQNDFEHFVTIKGRLLKEFDELDRLKTELDDAWLDYFR